MRNSIKLELSIIIKQQNSMNGIRFQVEKLTQQINALLLHPKLPLTQHLYDINYYSFSQKVLHSVIMLIELVEFDSTVKVQFQKLIKITKQAAKDRPNQDSEDEEVLIPQGDQITAFLSNRKRILDTKVDQPDRVELYKFLASREQKQKDNSTFLQNLNKIKTNKTQQKDKKVKTNVSQTQTDISWIKSLDIKGELSQFEKNELKKQFQKYAGSTQCVQIQRQKDQKKVVNYQPIMLQTKTKQTKSKGKGFIEKSMDSKKSHISISSLKKTQPAVDDSSDIEDTSLLPTKKSIPIKKNTSKAKIIKQVSKVKRLTNDESASNKSAQFNSTFKQQLVSQTKTVEFKFNEEKHLQHNQGAKQSLSYDEHKELQNQVLKQKCAGIDIIGKQPQIVLRQHPIKVEVKQNNNKFQSKLNKQIQQQNAIKIKQRSKERQNQIDCKIITKQLLNIEQKKQKKELLSCPSTLNHSQINTRQSEAEPKKQLKLRTKSTLPLLKKSTAKINKADYQPQSQIIYEDDAECSLQSLDDCKTRLTDKATVQYSHFKYENQNKQRSNTFDKISPFSKHNTISKWEQNTSNRLRQKQNLPTISNLGSEQKRDQSITKNREKLKILSNSYHAGSNKNTQITRINKSNHEQLGNGRSSITCLKQRLQQIMEKGNTVGAGELAESDEKAMQTLTRFKMKNAHNDKKAYFNQHQLREIQQCTKMMETVHMTVCGGGCKHLQRFFSFLKFARSTVKKQFKIVNYLIDSQMIQ